MDPKNKLFRVALIFIPILFVIGVILNSFMFYAKIRFSAGDWGSELLSIAIIGLVLYVAFNYPRFESISITQKLRLSLFFVVTIYGVGLLMTLVTQPVFFTPRYSGSYVLRAYTWSGVIVAHVIGFVAVLSLGSCLRILQTLIFYRRKKNTATFFHLFLLFGALTALSTAVTGRPLKYDPSSNHIITFNLLVITTIFLLINAGRVTWVTVLNRRQKFLTFIGGLVFTLISAGLLGAEIGGGATYADMVYSYSRTAGSFLFLMTVFVFVYSISTTINTLLHLPTAAIYDKKVREINSIYSLSRTINSLFDVEKIVVSVTELVCDATGANACWLELANTKNPAFRTHFDFAAVRQREPFQVHFLEVSFRKFLSKHENARLIPSNDQHHHYYLTEPTDWIINNKQPILINQVKRDKRTKDLKRTPIESLVGVPLITSDGMLGIIFAVKSTSFGFDQDDIAIISALANQTTVAIENTRLVKESLEKERLAEELRIAHDVQMKLIPQEIPDIRHDLSKMTLDIGATTVPANEVGGDYYDFVRLADWRCGIAVADVSGKGTSAAFYMAEIKGIIQALAGIYSAPKDLLIAVNDVLFGTIDRKSFITLLYADVDISKSELRFARAGHCPLLHMRDGVKTYIQPNGIGLGLDKGNLFRQAIEEKTIRIDDRDVFVMYSDGLVEARNAKDEEYGEERLSKCLDGVEHLPAGVIKDIIIADVKRFVGSAKTHDDLTCVVFRLADLQKQVVPVAPVTEAETGEITAVRRV